jgi:hypothetical protein
VLLNLQQNYLQKLTLKYCDFYATNRDSYVLFGTVLKNKREYYSSPSAKNPLSGGVLRRRKYVPDILARFNTVTFELQKVEFSPILLFL